MIRLRPRQRGSLRVLVGTLVWLASMSAPVVATVGSGSASAGTESSGTSSAGPDKYTGAASASGGTEDSNAGSTGGSSGGGGAADPCTYQDPGAAAAGVTAKNAGAVVSAFIDAVRDYFASQGLPGWESGSMVVASCPGSTSGYFAIPGAEQVALPSPVELAVQASASVTVVTPPVLFSPYWLLEDGRFATLKNAQTWVWIDPVNWTGHSPRVEAGPVWVEATITPVQIVVSPNDGVTEPVTCEGPGTPIGEGVPLSAPSPTCSVQFAQQTDGNTWPVGVQVVYSVSWVGFDGSVSVSGTLEDLVSAPATYPLAVLTSQTRLVDPNASD